MQEELLYQHVGFEQPRSVNLKARALVFAMHVGQNLIYLGFLFYLSQNLTGFPTQPYTYITMFLLILS